MNIDDLFNMNSSTEKTLLKMSGLNPLVMITEMGEKLEELLRKELKAYYDLYSPKVYMRTHKTINDIKVRTVERTSMGYELIIDLNSNHRSIFDGESSNTLWLLNSGYISKKLEQQRGVVEHFTRFRGANYINKAIEKFNKSNNLDVQISLTYNGQDVTGREFMYGK